MHWLSPDELSETTLAEAMSSVLASPPAVVTDRPDLRGRQRAVEHLLARGAQVLPIPAHEDRAPSAGLMSGEA